MYRLKKIRGFIALPIIIGGALLIASILGGLAYEYKDKLAFFDTNNKNFVAQVWDYGTSTVPTCSTPWYFDTTTSICEQKQFCALYMYQGLQTFSSESECEAALPTIKILSPNGGETFTEGSAKTITWSSVGVDKVNIYLQTFATPGQWTSPIATIATNVSASLNQYSWQVPFGILGTNSQIVLTQVGGNLSDGGNNPFTIVASPSCDQKCKSSGYVSGVCKSFSVTPTGFAEAAEYKKNNLNIGETSDCFMRQGWLGGDISCYCPSVQSSVCTFFTYSNWGACQSNSKQIRDITNSGPLGCIGGNPVTSQSCNYSATQPILGGDKDVYGCIGSAGYSWCAIKNKCLRSWEEPCIATTTSFTNCDSTIKAVVDSVGGCANIDRSIYSNIYNACCATAVVTKEMLLSILNTALADGVINSQEKTSLLTALNSYLK